MIVPMKIVTILVMRETIAATLSALRDLGVMQVEVAENVSDDSARLSEQLASAARTWTELRKFAAPGTPEPVGTPTAEVRSIGRSTLETAARCVDRRTAALTELAGVEKRLRNLEPWGYFSRPLLDELRNRGVRIVLCDGPAAALETARALEGVAVTEFEQSGGLARFAVVSDRDFDTCGLPVVELGPEDDPAELRRRVEALREQIKGVETELTRLSGHLDAAKYCIDELENQLEFSRTRDAISAHGAVVSLRGFVPAPEVEKLRESARAEGWGLLILDPGPDDVVPVLIRENRFSRIIKPLFDFLGVVPGYREIDVSAGVLIFFTIFYAIIIGDAGYGVIFLVLSLILGWKLRRKPAALAPIRLFGLLSVATIIWGALNGSWFGLAAIPGTDRPFPGLPCFTGVSETLRQANIQAFCFVLAVAQLSLGRIWKAIHDANWRSIGENVGWMLILWGNFFLTIRIIVYPGEFPDYMYWLYGSGLALVVLCGVNWKDPAAVFQFPFNIVGSFTDVLSYIRLFAVGMAGGCIATSFNSMAWDVCKSSPWIIPVGILVVLCGHLLNVALGFMSVLVHGVRLNTLEFSNHVGLTWSGELFRPFKNHLNEK